MKRANYLEKKHIIYLNTGSMIKIGEVRHFKMILKYRINLANRRGIVSLLRIEGDFSAFLWFIGLQSVLILHFQREFGWANQIQIWPYFYPHIEVRKWRVMVPSWSYLFLFYHVFKECCVWKRPLFSFPVEPLILKQHIDFLFQ